MSKNKNNTNENVVELQPGAENQNKNYAQNPNIHNVGDLSKKFYDSMQNSAKKFDNILESVNKHSEAARDYTSIVNSSAENISNQMRSYVNDVYDSWVDVMNRSFNCYSVKDVLNLQEEVVTKYTGSTLKNWVDVTDIVFNLASDVQKPIQKSSNENYNLLEKAFTE
jgi:hypothetical protein